VRAVADFLARIGWQDSESASAAPRP